MNKGKNKVYDNNFILISKKLSDEWKNIISSATRGSFFVCFFAFSHPSSLLPSHFQTNNPIVSDYLMSI